MIELEKVIKAFDGCPGSWEESDKCYECPFENSGFCTDKLHDKVVELLNNLRDALNDQEAKCLTKAELDGLDEDQFVWIEGRNGDLFCLQIIGICRGRTGVSDIQFDSPKSYVERSTNTYGKSYRIWTDKPTEEQSKAVKWE